MKRSFSLALTAVGALLWGYAAQAQTPEPDPALIEKGRYLAVLSDCSACHTARGGRPEYSGGYPFKLPIGTLYSTNITPDPTYGIGSYSEADFARAVRQGIRKDGMTLYPAMPYPSYARMTDADIHALYVYFRYGVAPQAVRPTENTLPWPLSMRWPLQFWRLLFGPDPKRAEQATTREFSDPVLARGAYLVEGPGHCGACHSPRHFLTMQEETLSASEGPSYLAGGSVISGWLAPSLRQENRSGLGRWNEDDIVSFLKTGRIRHGSSFGGMTSVIVHSSQYFTDDDLHAIAKYLLQLKPADTSQTPWTYDGAATARLQNADLSQRGAKVYVDNCAACHRTDGKGYPTVFPPLAGNPVVIGDDPVSLVHIVQSGATLPSLHTAPSALTMPAFERRLSDQQIADVVTFIRQAWGNNASAVSAEDVDKLKKTMPPINMSNGVIPQN